MVDVARNKTAISNVRVFDGSRITEPRTVIINGNVISDDPEGGEKVIDGEGGVLIPGLIDAHVHLQHLGHLQELAKYGITTALDMACWPADKINSLRDKSGSPDIRSAGLPVTATGRLHSHILPLPVEAMLAGPEKAHEFVGKRVAEGSDYIKIICDIPGPTQETLNEVVRKAHDRNKKVVAHASAYTPFCMALEAGADLITHVPRDKPVDIPIVKKMISGKVISVPTLIMMKEVAKGPRTAQS